MVWIKSIRPDENRIIKELHDYRVRTHGYWPNVLAGQSLKPEVLKRMLAFQDLITFGGSGLGRRKEELISFHVSALNECRYWTVSHGEFLRKTANPDGEAPDLVKQVKRDFYGADLDEQEKLMLEFVTKMTLDSKSITEADVQRLREGGFDDVQILEIVQLAGWFNCITRIADALGIEVEEWRADWKQQILSVKPEAALRRRSQ